MKKITMFQQVENSKFGLVVMEENVWAYTK